MISLDEGRIPFLTASELLLHCLKPKTSCKVTVSCWSYWPTNLDLLAVLH